MNGYAYLLKRSGGKVRFICPINCKSLIRYADPMKSGLSAEASQIAYAARFEWELCLEPGTIEDILNNLKSRGMKLLPGSNNPEIKKFNSSRQVSQNSFLLFPSQANLKIPRPKL